MVSHLFAGQDNLVGIDDDDVVATFYVGRIAGFVFTHENFGYLRAETTEMQTCSVDHVPCVVDAGGIGREGSVT